MKKKFVVIDNETQDDITIPTLTQIIFGAEKKSNVSAPLDILKSIIKEGDGGFSSFLAKLGLFKAENNSKPSGKGDSLKEAFGGYKKRKMESSESVEEKLASLINSDETRTSTSDSIIPHLPGNGFRRVNYKELNFSSLFFIIEKNYFLLLYKISVFLLIQKLKVMIPFRN